MATTMSDETMENWHSRRCISESLLHTLNYIRGKQRTLRNKFMPMHFWEYQFSCLEKHDAAMCKQGTASIAAFIVPWNRPRPSDSTGITELVSDYICTDWPHNMLCGIRDVSRLCTSWVLHLSSIWWQGDKLFQNVIKHLNILTRKPHISL